ncbi:hypothetical protein MnBA_36780 [Marinobacterium sp. BA1]
MEALLRQRLQLVLQLAYLFTQLAGHYPGPNAKRRADQQKQGEGQKKQPEFIHT